MSSGLYYPRPRHEDYELARLIHDIQESDELFSEFMAAPEEFVGRYDLDDEAQKLMITFDYDGLVDRGIHPMLSVQFMRNVQWNLKMTVAKKESV